MGYAEEKFGVARTIIGKRKGGARSALFDAFVQIGPVEASDLPAHLQSDFQQLIDDLTCVEPVADEGRARATINAMDKDEVSAMSARIRDLADRLGC